MNACPLAWYFGSPATLGLLVAAAIPWIVHLWTRRHARRAPWAAMALLAAAVHDADRKLRIRNFFLLLMRTLVVTLIVLACADPRVDNFDQPASSATTPVHRVLMLDVSYSMAYESSGTTALDRAKEAASAIVARAGENDFVSLVLLTRSPRPVFSLPIARREEILQRIDGATIEDTTIDVPAACRVAADLIAKSSSLYSRGVRHEVVVLSDMRRIGWTDSSETASPSNVQSDAVRAALAKLADSARFAFLDVGLAPEGENTTSPANVGAVDLRLLEPGAGDATLRFEATVRSYSTEARLGLPVELWVDDRRVDVAGVDVAAGRTTTALLSHAVAAPGAYAVEVRLPNDALAPDNRRSLALTVRPRRNILVVENASRETGRATADFYLRAALTSDAGMNGAAIDDPRPTYVVETISDAALAAADLSSVDGVVFCDVPRFTWSEVRKLEGFLREGGGAVFFLGPNVDAADYNEKLVDPPTLRSVAPILPAKLGTIAETIEYRTDPIEYAHPVTAPFRDSPKSGLLTTPVDRYITLAPRERLDERVVLRLSDGAPLIVEQPVAAGRVVLVATTADTAWSPMPLWPSYVPLLHEILAFATQGRRLRDDLRVGEPIDGRAPDALADKAPTVRTPDGEDRPSEIVDRDGSPYYRFEATDTAGFYRVSWSEPNERTTNDGATDADAKAAFAVNANPNESYPQRLTREQFLAEFGQGLDARFVSNVDELAHDNAIGPADQSLAAYLLLAAILLAIAETAVARRLDRGQDIPLPMEHAIGASTKRGASSRG